MSTDDRTDSSVTSSTPFSPSSDDIKKSLYSLSLSLLCQSGVEIWKRARFFFPFGIPFALGTAMLESVSTSSVKVPFGRSSSAGVEFFFFAPPSRRRSARDWFADLFR